MEQLGYTRARLDRTALADDNDAPLTFVASGEAMNRKGYNLRNEGWRLDNYNANPIVLWMHDSDIPPLARGLALSKNRQIILDDVSFDREDEFARQVESKYRRGFLNAVSVSWRPMDEEGAYLDMWNISLDEIGESLFYDLVEVSLVTTPGDPRALRKQSRLALAQYGKELVALFDEQEHGEATADELDAAVRASLDRLGLDTDALAKPVAPQDEAPKGLDAQAAQAVLAAFNQEGDLRE